MGESAGLRKLIEEAIERLAKRYRLDKDIEWLKRYIQVHAVDIKDSNAPISDSGLPLAASELERSFPVLEERNPLLDLFEDRRKDGTGNEVERELSKSKHAKEIARSSLDNWTLWSKAAPGTIRDLERIAGNDSLLKERKPIENCRRERPLLKKYSYYAIIQADGDRFGQLIQACERCGRLQEFSQACWVYSQKAAGAVADYGGAVIYAGGDDLLCIVPLDNEKYRTVFDLLLSVRKRFDEAFKGFSALGVVPTLSFGVAMRFYKYPLYEAFKEAYRLLQTAKDGEKNTAAMELQKHSGQKVGLAFQAYAENTVYDIVSRMLLSFDPLDETAETLLHSVETHLRGYEELFALALQERGGKQGDTLEHVFANTFDHEIHTQDNAKLTLDYVRQLLEDITDTNTRLIEGSTAAEPFIKEKQRLAVADEALRLVRFFAEKGAKKDSGRTDE